MGLAHADLQCCIGGQPRPGASWSKEAPFPALIPQLRSEAVVSESSHSATDRTTRTVKKDAVPFLALVKLSEFWSESRWNRAQILTAQGLIGFVAGSARMVLFQF